jgi:Tfp pilus assembly protein PilE
MSFEKPWGNYLLDNIIETTAPETISFFPQTIAWKIISIVLIILIIKKAYQSWKTYQANAYRREALAWLAQCSLTNEEHIRQLPTLLRKTALLANQVSISEDSTAARKRHQEITQLTGPSWAAWLEKQCPNSIFSLEKQSATLYHFSNERLLAQLPYVPKLDLNDIEFNKALKQLYQQISVWIQCHQLNDECLVKSTGAQA